MLLLSSVLLIFVSAFATPAIGKFIPNKQRWLFALTPLTAFAILLSKAGEISTGAAVSENYSWIPRFGINFHFRLDGLSLLMGLLVTGIGALILTYACGYMKDYKANTKFYTIIQMFMAAMLGLVLSDNLIILFVFWELTTITCWFQS